MADAIGFCTQFIGLCLGVGLGHCQCDDTINVYGLLTYTDLLSLVGVMF